MTSKQSLWTLVGTSVFIGGMIAYVLHPTDRYSNVVESVQAKTVMVSVPSIQEQTFIVFTSSGIEIHTSTEPVVYNGAGVFVSQSGLILTCEHVVAHKLREPIRVILSNGTSVKAKLLYKDKAKDLALLKVMGKYRAARLTNKPLRLGQEVIAVGNPEGQSFSSSHGIISALGRDIGEEFTFTQTDAPINPGNSGGPLFNMQGELIGINARKYPNSDGLGLAIAPETIKSVLELFRGL